MFVLKSRSYHIVLVALVFVLPVACIGCTRLESPTRPVVSGQMDGRGSTHRAKARPTLLRASQEKLDFGQLRKKGRGEQKLWLHNTTDRAVEVAEVITSCPCFTVVLGHSRVDPGDKL